MGTEDIGRRGIEKNNINSFGIQPPREWERYLNGTILIQHEKIQPKEQVFCGHLCL